MIQSKQPHLDLRDIIREYYLIDLETDNGQKEIPIVDDCCHDIVVFKERKAKLQYGLKGKITDINSKIFTILGLESPYKLRVENSLTFFTIKFQPWMNRFFFGKLNQTGIVSLETNFTELEAIYEQLYAAEKFQDLVELANQYFVKQNIEWTSKMLLVKSVCEYVNENQGLVKVKGISQAFDKSRQYINKIFRQEAMCSLRTFITSVRIMALIKQKAKSEDLSLTQLTYNFGYFDQAHFIKDFKKVCGVTPSSYFENLPEFILRHN